MNKPEEVFASWDRSTRPNAAREVISRLLFHVPQVEGTGGERAKVSADAMMIRNIGEGVTSARASWIISHCEEATELSRECKGSIH